MKCLRGKCNNEITQTQLGRYRVFCSTNCRIAHWKSLHIPTKKKPSKEKVEMGLDEYKSLLRKTHHNVIEKPTMVRPAIEQPTAVAEATKPTEKPSHLTGIASDIWDKMHQQKTA